MACVEQHEADFCIAALEEALAKYGQPDIFDTDQGSQFTSPALPGFWRPKASGSAWMGAAAGWTTFSLSGCGVP